MVIPAANVLGGADHGSGQPSMGDRQAGGGFGLWATPVGVYVINGDTVTWQPALNLNSVILGGQIVAIVLLLTIRSLVRARAVRRAGLSAPVVRSARGWRGRLRLVHR